MADQSVTAADVTKVSGTEAHGTSGAAGTAGMPVYKDSADSNNLNPADSSTAAKAAAVGLLLNSAPGADQPVTYLMDGVLDPGFTATEGVPYWVSENSGKICPFADLATDEFVTYLGTGNSDGNINLNIHATGSQVQ